MGRPLTAAIHHIVALLIPLIPVVQSRQSARVERRIRVAQIQIIAGFQRHLARVALHVRLPLPNRDFQTVPDAEAYFGRAFGGHGSKRRVNTIHATLMPGAQRRQSLVERDLRELAIFVTEQRFQRHQSAIAQSENAAVVELQFRPSAVRHPYLGILSDRQVGCRRRPFQSLIRPPRHIALYIRKTRQPNHALIGVLFLRVPNGSYIILLSRPALVSEIAGREIIILRARHTREQACFHRQSSPT